MYSFEYTPLYNFTGIQFSPNESLKRQLKFSFLLINCSFMKTSETLLLKPFRRSPSTTFKNLLHYRVEFKIEVQKTDIFLQRWYRNKRSFCSSYSAPNAWRKVMEYKFELQENLLISSLMRRKNYSESLYEKFNMLHKMNFFS